MADPTLFTTGEARALGLTRAQLRGPRYLRLAHGLVACLDDAIDERERLRLLASALPRGTAYSHLTAAALLGAPVDLPSRPHIVLTPRRVLPQHAGLVVHRRMLSTGDVVRHRGLLVTSGAQTYLDLAAALPPAELVAVGDALWRAGHVDPGRLAARLGRADRIRGVVRARACAPLLSPLAQSRPESLMRYWLLQSDLPDPEPQVPVTDRRGRVVAHGDLGTGRRRSSSSTRDASTRTAISSTAMWTGTPSWRRTAGCCCASRAATSTGRPRWSNGRGGRS